MSNNLGGTEVAPGMDSPEVAVNDRLGRHDAALTEWLALDLTAADRAVTLNEARSNAVFIVTAGATLRTITLPAMKRQLCFVNVSANPSLVKLGATEIELPANASATLYADGSADGLRPVGGGGGGSGGGPAFPEAPSDGKQYGRQNEGWTEIVHGSEGGGTDPGGGDGGGSGVAPARGFRVVYQPGDGYFAFAVAEFRMIAADGSVIPWPAGTVFSSNSEAAPAANAADGDSGSRWESAAFGSQRSQFPVYWQALFPAGVTREIAAIEIQGRNDGSDPRVAEQAGFAPEFYTTSGDGTFYIKSKTFLSSVPSGYAVVNRFGLAFGGGLGGGSSDVGRHWRVRIIRAAGTACIGEVVFSKSSNGAQDAIGGAAIQSSIYGSGYEGSKAFDGNLNAGWYAGDGRWIGEWIGYSFPSPVSVKQVTLYRQGDNGGNYFGTPAEFAIDVSDDLKKWKQVGVFSSTSYAATDGQVFNL